MSLGGAKGRALVLVKGHHNLDFSGDVCWDSWPNTWPEDLWWRVH